MQRLDRKSCLLTLLSPMSFSYQRVNQCLRDVCNNPPLNHTYMRFIDCGLGNVTEKFGKDSEWISWTNNTKATACFDKEGGFSYGIYDQAVKLTTIDNIITRYIYSLFWGFQVIFYRLYIRAIILC